MIERAIFRHSREVDVLTWSHLAPFLDPAGAAAAGRAGPVGPRAGPTVAPARA